MKTQVLLIQQRTHVSKAVTYTIATLFLLVAMAFNSVNAQTQTPSEITIKGMVSDEAGPLTGVNIALEGSNVGAITDTDGTFIFPKALQVGDVLVFSYLGYQTERIKIKADSSFINLQMTSEYIDIVGAPATNIPYKSKRSR